MRTSRVIAATISVVVPVLLLSVGCSAEEQPREPAPSVSSSVSPSVATAAPSTAASEAPVDETAKEFIRRWVEVSNQLQRDGEAGAYLDMVGPDCDSCHEFADRVIAIYEAGGSIEGGDEEIISFERESRTQWVIVRVAAPTTYTERADGAVQSFPGGRYQSRLYLARVLGKWIVGATEGVPL